MKVVLGLVTLFPQCNDTRWILGQPSLPPMEDNRRKYLKTLLQLDRKGKKRIRVFGSIHERRLADMKYYDPKSARYGEGNHRRSIFRVK